MCSNRAKLKQMQKAGEVQDFPPIMTQTELIPSKGSVKKEDAVRFIQAEGELYRGRQSKQFHSILISAPITAYHLPIMSDLGFATQHRHALPYEAMSRPPWERDIDEFEVSGSRSEHPLVCKPGSTNTMHSITARDNEIQQL